MSVSIANLLSHLVLGSVEAQRLIAERSGATRQPYLDAATKFDGVVKSLLIDVFPPQIQLQNYRVESRLIVARSREITRGLAVKPLNISYTVMHRVEHTRASRIAVEVVQTPPNQRKEGNS